MELNDDQFNELQKLVYYMNDIEFSHFNYTSIDQCNLLGSCLLYCDLEVLKNIYNIVEPLSGLDGEELKSLLEEENLLDYIEEHS